MAATNAPVFRSSGTVKIRLFERVLFYMESRLKGIWPQTGLRPASKLDSVMEYGRFTVIDAFKTGCDTSHRKLCMSPEHET